MAFFTSWLDNDTNFVGADGALATAGGVDSAAPMTAWLVAASVSSSNAPA